MGKVRPTFPVNFVSTLVLNVTMPALLFHTLATSVVPISSLWEMAFATLVIHIVFSAVALLTLKLSGKDWRLCISYVVGSPQSLILPWPPASRRLAQRRQVEPTPMV